MWLASVSAMRLSGATGGGGGTGDHGCEYMTGGSRGRAGQDRGVTGSRRQAAAWLCVRQTARLPSVATPRWSAEKCCQPPSRRPACPAVWHEARPTEVLLKSCSRPAAWIGKPPCPPTTGRLGQRRTSSSEGVSNGYKRALGEINAKVAAALAGQTQVTLHQESCHEPTGLTTGWLRHCTD